jgi:hypothetical protein
MAPRDAAGIAGLARVFCSHQVATGFPAWRSNGLISAESA